MLPNHLSSAEAGETEKLAAMVAAAINQPQQVVVLENFLRTEDSDKRNHQHNMAWKPMGTELVIHMAIRRRSPHLTTKGRSKKIGII